MEDREIILNWMSRMESMYKSFRALEDGLHINDIVPCNQIGRGIQIYSGIRKLSEAAGETMEFEPADDEINAYFIRNGVMYFQLCDKTEEGDADVA